MTENSNYKPTSEISGVNQGQKVVLEENKGEDRILHRSRE